MDIQPKTNEQLQQELLELRQEINYMKTLASKANTKFNNREDITGETSSNLKIVLQSGNMVWWEMDVLTGNVNFANRKAEMLGYAPEKFKHYKDFTNLVHPEDFEKILNAMRGHLEGVYDHYEVEYRILSKSGEYIWFYDYGSVAKKDSDGKPLIVTGLSYNIEDKKTDEERLLFISKAVESTSDVIGISDNKGRHFYQNKAFSDLFGYKTTEETEAAGGVAAIVKDPEVAEEMFRNIMNGIPSSGELEMVTKSGRVFSAYERTNAIKDTNGNIIGLLGVINDITEQKQNEETLAKSERIISSIYDSVENALFLLEVEDDECYRFVSVNKAYCKSKGLNEEMVVGKLISEVIPKNSLSIVKEKHRQAIKERSTIRWEETFDSPNGQMVGDISISPVFDDKGLCTHLVGSSHDITEKQELEKRILRDKKFANQLINSLPGLFYQISAEGKFVNWSENLETLSGYSHTEMSEISALDLFAGEDKLNVEKSIIQVFSEGKSFVEASLISKNHTKIPYYFTGKKIAIDDQIYLLGLGIDISIHKEDEEKLRESDVKFKQIYDLSPVGIMMVGLDKKLLHCNRAFEKSIGYATKEIAGLTIDEFTFPEDILLGMPEIKALIKGEVEVSTFRKRYVRKDKQVIWADHTISLFRDNENNPLYFIEIIQDITERKETEEERDRLIAIIEQSSDYIGTSDMQGNLLYHNQAAKAMVGLSKDSSLKGMKIENLCHERFLDLFFNEGMPTAIREGKWQSEIALKHTDGHEVPVSHLLMVHKNKEDTPIYTSTVMRDITNIKLVEEVLRENNSRMEFVMRMANMASWKMDTTTGHVTFDKRKTEMLGYSTKKFKHYKDFVNLLHPEDKSKVMSAMQGHLSGQFDKYDVEYRILSKSGNYLWFHDIGSIVKWDPNGKPLLVSGYVINITNQKQIEDVLRMTNKKLTEAQRLAKIGSWENDLIRNKLHWSEEMFHIWGIPQKPSITNRKAERLFPPEEIDRYRQAVNEAINTDTPYNIDYKIILSNGSIRYIHDEGEVIRDKNGLAVRMFGTTHDITEHMLSKINLKKINEHTEAQNEEYIQINNELSFQNEEKGKRAAELIVANEELAFQNEEKGKRAAELILANKELVFQNQEKEKRAAELVIANNELSFQNEEKGKRAAELIVANEELAFQNEEKGKRAVELVIANKELAFQNEEKIKRAEELEDKIEERTAELREKEENFRNMANNISQLAWMADEQGSIFWYNQRWFDYTGSTIYEMSGWGWRKVQHPDHEQSVVKKIKHCFETGEVWEDTFPLRGADGLFRWFLSRAVPIRNEQGTVVRWFGTNTDITESKFAEEKIKESELSLHEAQRMANMGDWKWDMLTLKQNWSDNYYEIFGFEPSEVEPSFENYKRKIHPDDLYLQDEYHAKIMKEKKPFDFESRIIFTDGSIKWIQNKIVPVLEEDKIVLLKGVIIDITARKKIEEELSKAKTEAERANVAKSEFLSRMSHELRTPMNSILGFAQLMNMGELEPTHKKGVDHILKSGKHLLNLINEVLDLSRIEAGELSISLEPVHLREIVSETTDVIKPLADKRKITLAFKESEINNLFIRADRQKLRQVLMNLINNAVKYNRKGGSVRVECSKQFTAGNPLLPKNRRLKTVKISVIDTGKGIAPEDIQKLFNPFQRFGTEISEVEGTGLGLAVAKKLMEAMNGTIGVESKLGESSTFWIELPQDENQVERHEQKGDFVKSETESVVSGTLLYIEDNISNIQLVEQILETHRPKINLISEMYGKRTVKLATDYKPDFILLDLDLPDIHGSEVLKLLLANDETKSIPVIILSADAMNSQVEKLMKAGAKQYLTKPLDVLAFLDVMDFFLKKEI